jgi:DNA invertase Pin-like site-specific DNA recombinase
MDIRKIEQSHLDRDAIIYLRQSTMPQLEQNQESTRRQYEMAILAEKLGWAKGKITILDADLGKSGTTTAQRTDFQRLMKEVIEGKVGAVFAIEISRLSRIQSHWHKLVEVCMLTNTLIIDYERVYDPNLHDDWMLLSIKSTWSTAELHMQWIRMQQAKLEKAKDGRLIFGLPAGYILSPKNQIIKDPHPQVQEIFELIFSKFNEIGTMYGVLTYLNDKHILIPTRKKEKKENAIFIPSDDEEDYKEDNLIEWRKPRTDRLLYILKNPRYAGAYVFGQHVRKPVLDPESGDVLRYRMEEVPMEDWEVIICDSFEGYITWDQYLQNLEQLSKNRSSNNSTSQRGIPRDGAALLQGLIWCGKCGQPMSVHYYSTDGLCCMIRRTVRSALKPSWY